MYLLVFLPKSRESYADVSSGGWGWGACFVTFHGLGIRLVSSLFMVRVSALFHHFPWFEYPPCFLTFHGYSFTQKHMIQTFLGAGAPNFPQISFTFHAVRHLSAGLSSSGTLVKVRYALHKPKKWKYATLKKCPQFWVTVGYCVFIWNCQIRDGPAWKPHNRRFPCKNRTFKKITPFWLR